MANIPTGSFVFTLALMCHGGILYRSSNFSHISRLISFENTEVGCPTHFAAIDTFLDDLYKLFYRDIDTTTESIINEHKTLSTYPVLVEKLLFYNHENYTEKINNWLGIKNKYEDGIYLISIHQKTETDGLQNIKIDAPLNLLLPESWTKLGITLYDSSVESLTSQFRQQIFVSTKKELANEFKLFIHKGRIQEIKLSTILELLSNYGANNETEKDMHFFNVYDFTCNNFASSMTNEERTRFTEEFKALGPFEITRKYGGKRNTRRRIKRKQ